MIWAEALELIKRGKRVRAVDWCPGCYCELSPDFAFITIEKRHSLTRRWMPFEAIACKSTDETKAPFQIHTGDTIGEWEYYVGSQAQEDDAA